MKNILTSIAFTFLLQATSFCQDLTKEQTIEYILNLSRKSNGLTYTSTTSNSKFSISDIDFFFSDSKKTYYFVYRATNTSNNFDNTETTCYNIDMTILDRFELSPKQTDDSPVRLLRVYLETTSVAVRDGWGDSKPSQDYFSVPFPNTTENYNKLIKAFTYLSTLDKKNKPKDPFDN